MKETKNLQITKCSGFRIFFFLLDASVASHRAFGFIQHHRKLDIETRCPSDTKACLKTFSVFSDIINAYQSCVKHLSRLELTFHGLTPSFTAL